MSNKKDSIKHLESTILILNDKMEALEATISEQKAIMAAVYNKNHSEWYEKMPFRETLCWVSNSTENPAKDGVIRLVTGYDGHLENPFCVGGGYWRYATPTPTKKLLEYSFEEQEHEQ